MQPRQADALAGCREIFVKAFAYSHQNTLPYISAIIPEKYRLNSLFKFLASKAEQFVCFSPAFIFEQLARGPPRSA